MWYSSRCRSDGGWLHGSSILGVVLGPEYFPLGEIKVSQGAREVLNEAGVSVDELTKRYQGRDWGDCSSVDKNANEFALAEGKSIMAVYKLPTGRQVWIITGSSRSWTTVTVGERRAGESPP